MTIHIWTGAPPAGYEAEMLASLYDALSADPQTFSLLANIMVNGREIDLVALKPNGAFLIEYKWCERVLTGAVNGPWIAQQSDGHAAELNGGRENPYRQLIINASAFSRWLQSEKKYYLSAQRCRQVRFTKSSHPHDPKPMRVHNLLVIVPDLHPDSRLELDWRATVMGAPQLAEHIRTQSTPRLEPSLEEQTAIARELWLSPWTPNRVNPPALLPPENAPMILRHHLALSQVETPNLLQAFEDCWRYLRWALHDHLAALNHTVKTSSSALLAPTIFSGGLRRHPPGGSS